jgi:hypothetical protein
MGLMATVRALASIGWPQSTTPSGSGTGTFTGTFA